MKILDTIASVLKSKKAPTAAVLAGLLAQTKAETEAASARLLDLETRRPEMALAGEGERLSFRADLTLARDDVADGEAAIEALTGKHEAALVAEAEDERKRAHKAAKATASELTDLIAQYEKASQAVRDVIARIAVIDGVVAKANSDLPAGFDKIPSSTDLRGVPAMARVVLSETTVDLWCNPGSTEPLPADLQSKVVVQPDGTGYLSRPKSSAISADHSPVKAFKRTFIRREFREGKTAEYAVDLKSIKLPAAYVWPLSKRQGPDTRPIVVEHRLVKAAT